MDAARGELLYGLGRAQAGVLRTKDALDSLSRAFDCYVEVGDIAQSVAVANYSNSVYKPND